MNSKKNFKVTFKLVLFGFLLVLASCKNDTVELDNVNEGDWMSFIPDGELVKIPVGVDDTLHLIKTQSGYLFEGDILIPSPKVEKWLQASRQGKRLKDPLPFAGVG
ncbi:MAG: hypothetical protein ACFB0B_18115 [Thermonemataceae bacterium]